MFAQHCKEVDGSSWIGEDEDVLSLENAHDNCEEEDEHIKVTGSRKRKRKTSSTIAAAALCPSMLPPAVTVLPSPSTPRLCLDCFSLVDDAAWSNRSNSLMPRQVFDFQESYGGVVKDCWSRAGELIADFKTGGKITNLKGGFRAEDLFFGAGTDICSDYNNSS
ncbi:hypothetical protein Q3G72_008336 [Acer saccharum]|nr:hypothetical protein Q3G72_008336 [Acer saccharum]